jgi:hypothetical protein
MVAKSLKVTDRVVRINARGCRGVVKDIRQEVTAASDELKERGLLVCVLWDNGTLSYFSPEALEVVQEG